MSTIRDRIKSALHGTGRPMSAWAIGRRLGYDHVPGWIRQAVEEMVADGEAVPVNGCPECGHGKRYREPPQPKPPRPAEG